MRFPWQAQQLKLRGFADYLLILTGTVKRDLILADWSTRDAKEAFADFACGRQNVNITNWKVQGEMCRRLEAHGFDGWFSHHDKSDDRMEFCVFPPRLEKLSCTDRYFLGP